MEKTHFQEPKSAEAFDSATATHRLDNCTACGGSMNRRSPSSTPSLQEPNPSSCWGLNTQKQYLSASKTLDGFTKIPLPITSSFTWATPDSNPTLQPAPTLRRCVSDPVSSPGTPSPAKAGSSASVTLPVVPAVFRRSFSDPSPEAYHAAVTPPDSVNRQGPKSKRMKRMKDGMREMRQWLDEVMREGEEEDGGSELDDKNGAPKVQDHEPETESEEAVSVETSGKVLIIHIKCPCGKGFKILLNGNNCYYKLL
ncbi:hypothetical protein RHSIM_Rhsim07G0050800 [Rhododendron simsii]|uniref:Uncharacterized protein n=1 Tax=Rhododendron simsii TaxID=118357 RepID=A0A834GQ30_RHOSS|nr:hypothetical protein RHSIM_Rhsim07G0050800 [Rhododendron simsii]